MEDVPPSYQSAIDREAWNVIAPWIPSSDLCSACLVSRKWHSIFVPFLWGDPARHFGIQNDAVFVALTRFKRTLRKARVDTRGLTHTLHLPPALSEIYGGPNREWLREVLEYLPNLQSLIVSKLPFFDHHSLLALRSQITRDHRRSFDTEEEDIPVYGLKLLLATHEPNATAVSIASALPCFQALVYLDLSYTTPARDAAVLASLGNLYDLQVLKLRGVGLRDGEAEVLANAISIRVRLLDLAENFLTDMAVRSLLQACFMPRDDSRVNGSRAHRRHVEDWPVGIAPGPDFFSLDTLRSEDLDHELLKQLTNPLTGRLAFEDIPHRGLTHLYISDNHLSVEGLNSLLKSERLHVLDGGSADSVKTIARTRSLSSPTGYTDEVKFPSAEKLIPTLVESAAKNLTHLRVDYTLVTEKLELAEETPSAPKYATELPGSASLAAELSSEDRLVFEAPAPTHHPVEMPSEQEAVYEMDATPAQPRYELIGDIMQFALSPPIGERPDSAQINSSGVIRPVRGEGPYAPEMVTASNGHLSDDKDEDVVLNASGTGLTSRKLQKTDPDAGWGASVGLSIPCAPATAAGSSSAVASSGRTATHNHRQALSISVQRQIRIDSLLQKRPPSVAAPRTPGSTDDVAGHNLAYLHPSALPNLRTLILTEVPPSVPASGNVVKALKSFISSCADEAALASLQAQTNYSLPPGRARHAAELDHARSLFALRTIVLEMTQPGVQSAKSTAERGWHSNKQRIRMSKSSTGDHDSENLWSAAENDFSFFGEEGEEQDECGIYENEPDKYFPTAHMDDKILVSPQDSQEDIRRTNSPHGSSVSSLGYTPSLGRSSTVLRSPRELPLGRNRRRSSNGSGDFDRDREDLRERIFGPGVVPNNPRHPAAFPEMPGSTPAVTRSMSALAPLQLPRPTSSLSQLRSAQQTKSPSVIRTEETDGPMVEVVAELAAWRRERKKAYENAVVRCKLGAPVGGEVLDPRDMPFVEGHWQGEIRVVRNAAPKGRTGIVDMYGNYFEKGYLYP